MNETKSNEHHGMLFGCSCCAGGIHQRKAIRQWSRRGFLSTGIAGALATTLALPQRARAQSTLSPDAALQALLDRGVLSPDRESLERKKKRVLEPAAERTNRPTVKYLRPEIEIPADTQLMIEHARKQLLSDPM